MHRASVKVNEKGVEKVFKIKNSRDHHLADAERFVTSSTYVLNIADKGDERLVGYRVVMRRDSAEADSQYYPSFVITDHPTHSGVGMGVFALQPFRQGSFLMPYQGVGRITEEDLTPSNVDNLMECARRTWWEEKLGLHDEQDEAFFKTQRFITFPPRPCHRACFMPSFEYVNTS